MSAPSDHGSSAPNTDLLREMVREAERVLDLQVRAFERADDKSDRLMGLGAAILGGGLTIATAGTARTSGSEGLVFALLVGLASATSLAALAAFFRASLGLMEHNDARVGASPHWIARRSTTSGWTDGKHLVAVLDAAAEGYLENLAILEEGVQRRRHGLLLLLCAVVLYAAALLLLTVGGTIA